MEEIIGLHVEIFLSTYDSVLSQKQNKQTNKKDLRRGANILEVKEHEIKQRKK